jgi:hypothetical protein
MNSTVYDEVQTVLVPETCRRSQHKEGAAREVHIAIELFECHSGERRNKRS